MLSNIKAEKNVVILIADDLGYSDLSCFGNAFITTPYIDQLAGKGLKLTRMYSVPSDAGSLAAILTGMKKVQNVEHSRNIKKQ